MKDFRAAVAVLLAVGGADPAAAQSEPDWEGARQEMIRWLGLVAGDAADRAREQASPLFRDRITSLDWGYWVFHNHQAVAEGAARRRVVESTSAIDQPPLPEIQWARVVFARERPRGGRLYERVIALVENGRWRVADYVTWVDAEGIVTSTGVDPIPFQFAYDAWYLPGHYLSGRYFRGHPGRGADRTPPPGAGPKRPTAVANPKTFPRKPPATR
ncbi:MAG: DUF4019 domain-containing protein [Gemmatimonadales bacterium]